MPAPNTTCAATSAPSISRPASSSGASGSCRAIRRLGPQDHPDLERAIETWDPDSRWDVGGGGAPWDAINYDAETGLVLVGTGNGGPYHTIKRSPKGGDQLYLASIVALDAKTGRLKWFYQQTPGDNWDFTSTQPMILTRMMIDGEQRPVVIHAPKNGFLYVLDRRDGKLLRANPIVRTNWATSVDLKTGRPAMDPAAADYGQGPKIVFPATPGARNWHPASFDPESGLYYASVLDMGNLIFTTPGQKPFVRRMLNNDAALIFGPDLEAALPTLPPPLQAAVKALPAFEEVKRKPYVSELRAIDPLTGQTRWAAPTRGWQDRARRAHDGQRAAVPGQHRRHVPRLRQARRPAAQVDRHGQLDPRRTDDLPGERRAVRRGDGSVGRRRLSLRAALLGRVQARQPGANPRVQAGRRRRAHAARAAAARSRHRRRRRRSRRSRRPPSRAAARSSSATACCAIRTSTARSRRTCAGCSPARTRRFAASCSRARCSRTACRAGTTCLSPADVDAIHAYLIDLQAKTRADELAKQKAGVPLDAPSLAILSNY